MTRRHYSRTAVGLAIAVTLLGAAGIAAATAWTVSLAAGSKAQAQTPTATPAPTGVTATCATGTKVTVSWTAETGAASYTVYDSTTSATGPWTSLGTGTSPFTTASLTGTSGGTGYWFAVTTTLTDAAWGASTQSTASAKRTITTTTCA
jgi:hypothetical protein